MGRMIVYTILTWFLVMKSADSFYPAGKAQKSIQPEFKGKEVAIENIDLMEMSSAYFLEKRGNFTAYKLKLDGIPSGYVFFTKAKGRFDFFEYMVILSEQGSVQKVKVLQYISEHGGEIRSSKWLDQFCGYTSGPLVYGKDIQALSGATISAGAITKDIFMLVDFYQSFIKGKH